MALGENAADHQSSSYKISMSLIRRSLQPCTRRISLNRHRKREIQPSPPFENGMERMMYGERGE